MRALAGILPVLAAGCYTVDEFRADLVEATCDLYARCELLEAVDYADRGECVEEMSAVQADDEIPCDPYDPRAARECIDALNQRDCDSESLESWPEACAEACPEQETAR